MKPLRAALPSVLVACVLLTSSHDASAQANPYFFALPDIGFRVTPVEELPVGLHFGAEVGPTGGPYRYTEFFQGMTSTEANGAWAKRDNVWGLCFNLEQCSGQRILPDLYDFSWTWESAFQVNSTAPTLVENNLNVRYADGTEHRPWAFHIWTEQKAAVLSFSSKPDRVNFHINQNGNVVIGTPFRQPVKQLEVVGDALFTQNVEVTGNVKVAGASVLTASSNPSSGPLQWGASDGAGFATAEAVCAASRLACRSGLLPSGAQLACSVPLPAGSIFFALCQ
jgi:hypothetical protein